MKNKITQLLQLALISSSAFAASSARADLAPFDLVSYDGTGTNYLMNLSQDKETIQIFACPQNKWITQQSQCSQLEDGVPVVEFPVIVKTTILNWVNTNSALTPLSVNDIKQFANSSSILSSPRTAELKSQIDRLNSDLNDISEMLSHLPGSVDYQKKKADCEANLTKLNAEFSKLSAVLNESNSVNQLVNDLTANLFKLISDNNPKDNKLNTYARDQMKNSLLDQTVQALIQTAQNKKQVNDAVAACSAEIKRSIPVDKIESQLPAFCAVASKDAIKCVIKKDTRRKYAVASDLVECLKRNP